MKLDLGSMKEEEKGKKLGKAVIEFKLAIEVRLHVPVEW